VADARELILARLVTVCAAVEGVQAVARNRLDVGGLGRPAIVILDGSEQFTDAPPTGLSMLPQIQRMELSPALSIHVRGTDAVDGGGLLSLYRSRVLAAVLGDATLLSYCWQGRIRYGGAVVAVPGAEAQEHRIDLSLVFTYTWNLADLAA
jgi:hypothetical protein